MFRLLSAYAAMIGVLLIVTPLYAQQNGDMFGNGPALSPGQADMFPSQTPQAPAADMFQDQSAAPAPDMFPQQTPNAPSADMFDGVPNTFNSGNQDMFPSHAPASPRYHNPNASDQ